MPEVRTRFGLLRHAPTRWNEEKRIQGRLDSPLTDKGLRMALQWGRQLRDQSWRRILCSDLGRARQTADCLNRTLDLELHYDNKLQEQDWGEWSGLTLDDLRREHRNALQEQEQRGWLFTPPGGESRHEVLVRAMAAFTKAHLSWPGEAILVVCHEGVIKCLLYHLTRRSFLPGEPRILNSYSLHLLEMSDEALALIEINHLAMTEDPDGGP